MSNNSNNFSELNVIENSSNLIQIAPKHPVICHMQHIVTEKEILMQITSAG